MAFGNISGAFDTSGNMKGEQHRGPLGYVGEKFIGENNYNPEAGVLNTQRADAERFYGRGIGKQQQGFADYLQAGVQGQGPTVAGQQMAAGRAQAIQAARSQAASARGGNVALANRMSATGQAQAVQGANRDAAMLRAQEQISREQLLMQQQQNQRMAELQARGMSIDEAKAQLQAETAAMQARTTISEGEATRGQGPGAALMGAVGGLLAASDVRAKEDIQPVPSVGPTFAERLHSIQAAPAPIQAAPVAAPPPTTAAPAPQAGPEGGTSGNLMAGFQIGQMLSDARAKEAEHKVQSLSAELEKLRQTLPAQIQNVPPSPTPEQSRQDLGPVQPYTYRYKPEAAAAFGTDMAPRAGVMAQDLQQSPAYQASVIPTPQGLALDKERLLSANTAEIGGIDKRLRELEAAQGNAIERVNAPVEKPRPKAQGGR
jgi:hypothetical protein